MPTALHLTTDILPGKRIEITSPELPDNGRVELVIYLPEPNGNAGTASGYPDALNAEYNSLIQTQWQRPLQADETARLGAIRAQINALDAESGADEVWQRPLAQIHEQLAAIRREVERLPDAS